jgi:hypothetical protein
MKIANLAILGKAKAVCSLYTYIVVMWFKRSVTISLHYHQSVVFGHYPVPGVSKACFVSELRREKRNYFIQKITLSSKNITMKIN